MARSSRRPISFGPPPSSRPAFTVGALAIAARRANAVGAVRLTCAPAGLEIELVRVFGFSASFAPGGVAEPITFRVPYVAVRGLVREGKTLYLALDPRAATPFNRFALARFTEDPGEALAKAYRARARVRVAGLVLPAPLGLLAASLAPSSLVSGALGLVAFASIAAAAAWLLLREAVAWQTWGGPISDRYRDALEAELGRRLGLVEAPLHATAPLLAPLPAPPPRPTATDAPSPAFVRGIAMAFAIAVVLVGAFGAAKEITEAAPPTVAIAEPGIAAAALGGVKAASADAPKLEPCVCTRAASPLWRDGMPKVAVLLFPHGEESTGPVEPKKVGERGGRYDFDVAVVDDASVPVRDPRVTLTFARRNKKGARVGATDRGLFWEGLLQPGRAMRWHVRAPGTELEIDTSFSGTLESLGIGAAPGDAFVDLTKSKYRAVRLHALAMLAYERDPRALDAIAGFGVAGDSEAPLVAAIARAAAPVFACDVRETSVCVFNASSEPATNRILTVVGSDLTVPLGVTLPVHEGRMISLPNGLPAGAEVTISGG